MQVVHIIATAGSAIISSCMGSMGASMAATGNGSLHKQATTPLKLGHEAILGWSLGDLSGDVGSDSGGTACLHSLALWHRALLPPALQLWGQPLNLPRVGGVCPMDATGWVGCNTSVIPGYWTCWPSSSAFFSHGTGGV